MKIVAVIIAVVLLIQAGAAQENSGWVGPESFIYPLKIWMEKFSLNFVSNQTEKAWGMLNLAEERLIEAEKMENNAEAFERAMKEYADQLEELHSIIEKDAYNNTKNIQINITEKIKDHRNRTKALKGTVNVGTVQQSIIEASSSSGESKIKVSAVNGDVSVYTEGGNATVTKDGNSVTVISETNNSRQSVIVRSSQNASSSVVQSSSNEIFEDSIFN